MSYAPRLCHVMKWDDFDGYGFNLHAGNNKPGQYIGKVDPDSPAESAGLKQGDKIIEVNGVNISNENHKQVVQRIKAVANETKLLVVDTETEKYFKERNIVIKGTAANVMHLKTPVPRGAVNGVQQNGEQIMQEHVEGHADMEEKRSMTSERSSQSSAKSDKEQREEKEEKTSVPKASELAESELISPEPEKLVAKSPEPEEPAPKFPEPEEPAPRSPKPEEPSPRSPEPEEPAPRSPEPEEPAPRSPEPEEPVPKSPEEKVAEPEISDKVSDASASDKVSVSSDKVSMSSDKISDKISSGGSRTATPSSERKDSLPPSPKSTPEVPPEQTSPQESPASIHEAKQYIPTQTSRGAANKTSGLNLNMTAAEMRAHLASRKKTDPRKDTAMDFRKKYEIIQTM